MAAQDWGRILKWVFFLGLLAAFIFGGIRGITCNRPPAPPQSALLQQAGYSPATDEKPDKKPENLPGVKPVLSGGGVVVRPDSLPAWPDSLHVEVAVVEDETGAPWVGAWVEGVPVHWQQLPKVDWPSSKPSPLCVVAEYSFPRWGAGVAWEPLDLSGVRLGLVATTGTGLDWAAVGARVSRRLGPLSVGASAGYCFGSSPGLHLGVSAGLAVDLR